MYKLDSTTTHAKGGVGPIEILSTETRQNELVILILSWASHILKRPASQSPLRACRLHLDYRLGPGYNSLDDLFVGTTTAQDPECTNTNTTNTTLRLLVLSGVDMSISLSRISRTFTGLRSLFLLDVQAAPQQTLALPLAHLEVLYLECWPPELTWDTPALRHVYLRLSRTTLTDVLDRSLGQYAHQIESLVLRGCPSPRVDLPSQFWAQFTALRLLGLEYRNLGRRRWSGWSVVPPPTHPCRFLWCDLPLPPPGHQLDRVLESVVGDLCARWTWNEGMRLVVGYAREGQFYVVKNIRAEPSIENMEGTVGILPEF